MRTYFDPRFDPVRTCQSRGRWAAAAGGGGGGWRQWAAGGWVEDGITARVGAAGRMGTRVLRHGPQRGWVVDGITYGGALVGAFGDAARWWTGSHGGVGAGGRRRVRRRLPPADWAGVANIALGGWWHARGGGTRRQSGSATRDHGAVKGPELSLVGWRAKPSACAAAAQNGSREAAAGRGRSGSGFGHPRPLNPDPLSPPAG